ATPVETRTFFYPGWTVEIDGHETPTTVVRKRGTMSFEFPEGTHRVVLQLRPTLARRIGTLVSAVTLAALALVSIFALGLARLPPANAARSRAQDGHAGAVFGGERGAEKEALVRPSWTRDRRAWWVTVFRD